MAIIIFNAFLYPRADDLLFFSILQFHAWSIKPNFGISVIRFGKILPLWQNVKGVGNYYRVNVIFGQIV